MEIFNEALFIYLSVLFTYCACRMCWRKRKGNKPLTHVEGEGWGGGHCVSSGLHGSDCLTDNDGDDG